MTPGRIAVVAVALAGAALAAYLIAEAGVPGFDAVAWLMAAAPAHTPRTVVEVLHTELKRIVASPEFQKRMLDSGLIAVDSPRPDQLKAFVASEITRWSKVVAQSGIIVEE